MGILCLAPASLWANPTGGNVTAGAVKIAGQGTSAVTITQASNLAVINWKTFSINSGESTSFLQPGVNSAALNRVLGGQTSLINGALTANGQVYLVNGNGIIVGPGGMINANAFTASTRNITDADFLSGNLHFTGSGNAGVQNLGTINALGGNIVLIGKTVDNEGVINAPKGTAGLVAGDDVLLAQKNADGSTVTVNPTTTAASASGQVGVKNGGAINAAAAELKAANGNIYALAVQNEGTIRATTVSHQGGHIWLTSDSGTVANAGTLDASATAKGGQGGTVSLKSATGTASHTGKIIATGGAGGMGGNADISGADVEFTGTVDLSAAGGEKGTLRLDPTDIDILTGGGTDLTAATIDPGAIVAALNGANVDLVASNSITVDNTIDATGNASPGNLILDAPTLQLNEPVMLNGTLSGTATQVTVGPNGLVQNGIDAVSDGNTVNLTGGTDYALTNEIVINKDLLLLGNGAILDGENATRVMEIDGGSVLISDVVIQDGNGASSLGASGSSWSGDGGGLMVYNGSSNVTFNNTTFVGNAGSSGGAIFSVSIGGASHSVLLEDCTLTGNSAILGSAIYSYGSFGGNSSIGLKEDTIAANSGTGCIYTTVLSSGNGSVSIDDTILVGNTDFSGESDYDNGGGGTLIDSGYNLYGQNGNPGGFVASGTGDILLGGGLATVLAPLSNYGGATPTMALVAGSPALEAGDPAFIESPDQRGVDRGVQSFNSTGSNSDIGAFEAQYVTAQANSLSVVYGTPPSFTYSITSGPATAIVTGSPVFAGPFSAGFYPGGIQQGSVSAGAAYILTFAAGDLTITPLPLTVDPDAGQGKIYGSSDPVLTYTTSGLVGGDTLNGTLSYNGAGTFTGVGNYATNLGTLSNGNYLISLSSSAPTFAITPRPVIVDPDPGQGKTYGSPDLALTYSTDPADTTSGLVNNDTLNGSPSYNGAGPLVPVGNYATNLGTLSNGNYNILLNGTAPTFAVTQRPVTVDPDPGQSKIYGTPDPALTYTTDPTTATTGLLTTDTLTGAPSYNGASQLAGAGSYAINLGNLANNNYAITLSAAAQTFTIVPRSVTISPDPGQGKVYGAPDPVLTFSVTPATPTTGLVTGDTLTGAISYNGAGQFANFGIYTMNTGTLANGNYTVSLVASAPTFAISQRPVLVLPDAGQSTTYGSPDPGLTYTTPPATTTNGLVNGDMLNGAPSYAGAGTLAPVGNYPTNLGSLSNNNYKIMLDPAAPTFAITPRPVTVDPDPGQGKLYGTADPGLTYTTDPLTTTTGLLSGDILTGALAETGAGQFSNAGSYAFNLGTLASTTNYVVALNASAPAFVIFPRLVTVTPDAGQGKIYGTADPVLTYTITPATSSSGLVNGDTLSGDVGYPGASQFASAGVYPIGPGTLFNGNYVIGLSGAPAMFTISQRSVTVLPDAGQGKVYGSPDPALTYSTSATTATTGLVNGDILGGGASYNGAGPFAPVGTYGTNLGSLSNSNYAISLSAVAPTFTISAATLYYEAVPFDVPPGGPFPSFTGTVVGFLGRDNQSTATTGTLTFDTTVTASAPDGVYPIYGSGLTASNYTFMQLAVNTVALTIGSGVTATVPANLSSSQSALPVLQAVAQASAPPPVADNGLAGSNSSGVPPPTAPPPADSGSNPISSNESLAPSADGTSGDDSQASAGASTGGLAQGSSYTQAAASASAKSGSTAASGPPLGPATMVAPGQTITISAHGAASASIPPPVIVQTQFTEGFTPQSRSTLSAALVASKSAAQSSPAAPPGGAMVAPGQTVTLTAHGMASASVPPPVMVQTQFDAGFSSQSRGELARAAGL